MNLRAELNFPRYLRQVIIYEDALCIVESVNFQPGTAHLFKELDAVVFKLPHVLCFSKLLDASKSIMKEFESAVTLSFLLDTLLIPLLQDSVDGLFVVPRCSKSATLS